MGTYYKGQRYGSSTVKIQDTGEDGLLQRLIEGTQTEDFVETKLTKVTQHFGNGFNNLTISATFVNVTSVVAYSHEKSGFGVETYPLLMRGIGYQFYKATCRMINVPQLESLPVAIFRNAKSLERLFLPNVKTTSFQWQFGNCSSLITADIGDKYVGTIQDSMFYSCTNLKALIIRASSMIRNTASNAFNQSSVANGTGFVYVPTDLVSTYQSATNWVTYASQIRPFVIATNPTDIQTKLNDTNVAVNTLIICDELDYDEGKYTLKIAEGQGEII